MFHLRKPLTVTLGVTGVLALAGSVAAAMATSTAGSVARGGAHTPALLALGNGPNAGMGCDDGEATQGQAGTVVKICQGAGGAYIGPEIGGVAYIFGANVVGPAQLNGVIVSGGTVGPAVTG